MDMTTANPKVYADMLALSRSLGADVISPILRELINVRVSQINGCAFCLAMHMRQARAKGESEERLLLLSAWRDAPHYSETERVVLELAEAVTLIASHGVSDELCERVGRYFQPKEYIELLAAINVINSWNRFMIATGIKMRISLSEAESQEVV